MQHPSIVDPIASDDRAESLEWIAGAARMLQATRRPLSPESLRLVGAQLAYHVDRITR
jgi:hypothetical protein